MKTNLKTIWCVALVLGWLWDFLFWEKTPGISFAIFVFLCVISGLFLLYLKNQKPSPKALFLLLPIVIFSILSFIRREPFSLLLSIGISLVLLQILAMTILGKSWLSYGLADYLMSWFRLWQSVIIHPIIAISQVAEPQSERKIKNPSIQISHVVRGIIITLPILVIYTVLLCSADAIFAQKFQSLIDLLSLEKLPEYILRLIAIFLIAYALAGAFYHAIEKSVSNVLYNENGSPFPKILGFTESTVVLSGVILLFAAFVIVQFQYFFGGTANIHIDGYTYSEYARRGFGELVAVALLTLLLLLVMSQVSRRENLTQRKAFSILSLTMVALVGIILVSAFERLLLYESVYGFTRLRTYTHIFMIWLGILLTATVLLEIFNHLRFFANATLLVALGFSLTLNLLNVDGYIVQRNVQRDEEKYELDAAYLAQLSTDAVPGMVSLFQSTFLSTDAKDSLGASLVCMRQLEPSLQSPVKNWQSFELSHWWARKAYQTIDNQLSKYEAVNVSNQWRVTSPNGGIYWCESAWFID